MVDQSKQIKLFYLDDHNSWQLYVQGELRLDLSDPLNLALKLNLTQDIPGHLLTVIPMSPLLQQEPRTITILLNEITKIQKLESADLILAIFVQQWNRVLALSFRSQDYFQILLEQIEMNLPGRSKLPCEEEYLVTWVTEKMNQVPESSAVDSFFGSEENISAFVAQVGRYQHMEDCPQKRALFTCTKNIFLKGDKNTLKFLVKQPTFTNVLLCLSLNHQFGDRMIDYQQQYSNMVVMSNVLNIQDPEINATYLETIRLKFIIHVATAMFFTYQIQAIIINENALILLKFIAENPQHLEGAANLAQKQPKAFIQLFAQLWELFKSVSQDHQTNKIKRSFKNNFVSQNLINISLSTMKNLVDQSNSNVKLNQQYLQAFNPFLSHNWNQSQQLLLFLYQRNLPHILDILKGMLQTGDYNTKSVVLIFAKNLVEPSQNRQIMKQKFLNYFYNQFVNQCVQYFNTTDQLDILVQFFLKLYKLDYVRTRRAIIWSQFLNHLDKKIKNKYIVILILKILVLFLENKDEGVFQYMNRRAMFKDLGSKYHEVKKYSPNGITYSLFLRLINEAAKSENVKGRLFVHNMLNPQQAIDIQF